ncbi:MAG: hypothetical protein AAFV07_20315, partial [Bacteroidota bacterium]
PAFPFPGSITLSRLNAFLMKLFRSPKPPIVLVKQQWRLYEGEFARMLDGHILLRATQKSLLDHMRIQVELFDNQYFSGKPLIQNQALFLDHLLQKGEQLALNPRVKLDTPIGFLPGAFKLSVSGWLDTPATQSLAWTYQAQVL